MAADEAKALVNLPPERGRMLRAFRHRLVAAYPADGQERQREERRA
jgi:hypothetical protein